MAARRRRRDRRQSRRRRPARRLRRPWPPRPLLLMEPTSLLPALALLGCRYLLALGPYRPGPP